eukprot:6663575-Pyramimonas_sp.AAC.1
MYRSCLREPRRPRRRSVRGHAPRVAADLADRLGVELLFVASPVEPLAEQEQKAEAVPEVPREVLRVDAGRDSACPVAHDAPTTRSRRH